MIVDSEVTSIVINLSERSITIASDEGELKKVEWKWDEEGAEGFAETIAAIEEDDRDKLENYSIYKEEIYK